MKAWTRATIVILVAVGPAACTLVLGVTDIPDEVDAGTGGSSSSASSASSSSGAPDGALPCPVIYVSASGDDGHDGCTHATPLKTIKAALSRVQTLGQPGYTIQVCAGSYVEDHLVIQLAGTIQGGYDCTGWTRTAGFGYPDFDAINETILTKGSPDEANHVTINVKAPAPDGGAPMVLDGLTIRGPDNLADSVSLLFSAGSAGTVSNCLVSGGDATATTIAVSVSTASPTFTMNRIISGVATGPSGVATGIALSGSPARIDTNILDASGTGSTSSPNGSYGIHVTSTSPVQQTVASGAPIINNHIVAGAGLPSIGILINGPAAVDVVGNVVQATKGAPNDDGGESNVGLVAVRANGSGPVHVLGNRLYGGGNSGMDFGHFEGVHLTGVSNAVVVNNMIYGGYHDPGDPDQGVAIGVQLEHCPAPLVEDNTIFAGYPGGTDPAYAVLLTNGTTDAALRNNILAGGGVNDRGLGVSGCAGELLALEHNLFLGFSGTTVYQTNCAEAGSTFLKDLASIAPLFPLATIDGNLIMASVCSAADTAGDSCLVNVACPGGVNSTACLGSLFNGWSPNAGYQDFLDAGWAPMPNISCRIAHGGLDLTGAPFPVTTDYYDAARGPMPTIGAAELRDAGCD